MPLAFAIDLVLVVGTLIVFLLLPGRALYRLIGTTRRSFAATITIELALGLALLLPVGLGLSLLGRIDSVSVDIVYGAFGGFSLVDLLARRSLKRPRMLRFSTQLIRRCLAFGLPYVIGLIIWFPYLSYHAGDLGSHVFWAQVIMSGHRLPNYDVAGPALPSILFVFGPHLLLAVVSLVSQVSIPASVPTMIFFGYGVILLAIQSITYQLTKSILPTFFTSLFFVTSQIPAARMLLGNFPDMIGYFLVASTVLSLVSGYQLRSLIVAAVIAPSIIGFYQYAVITETLLLAISGIGLCSVSFVRRNLSSLSLNPRRLLIPFGIALFEVILIFPQTFYLNLNSVRILQSTNYPPLEFADYTSNLGNSDLFLVGSIGLAYLLVLFVRKKPGGGGYVLLGAWAVALGLASSGPRLSIGVEPVRFAWHLVEPLAIASGVLLGFFVQGLFGSQSTSFQIPGIVARISYLSGKARTVAATIGVLALVVSLVIIPSAQFWSYREVAAQPFYSDDIAIGNWLFSHSDPDVHIAVDADVDSSASWIQAYAIRAHFLYKVDYAVSVAAPQFAVIYRDMGTLFKSPGSTVASDIVAKYNISYVVAHGYQIPVFDSSPFFTKSYQFGNSALFRPVHPDSYGYASMKGYLATTQSGRSVAVVSYMQINFIASVTTNLVIPVHGQIVDPPAPASAFALNQDGVSVGNYTCLTSPSIDINLGFQALFPDLHQSSVSAPITVQISLEPGSHAMTFSSDSSVLFEVYLDDLSSQKIGIDTSNLTVVNP